MAGLIPETPCFVGVIQHFVYNEHCCIEHIVFFDEAEARAQMEIEGQVRADSSDGEMHTYATNVFPAKLRTPATTS